MNKLRFNIAVVDNLRSAEIAAFIEEHIRETRDVSPSQEKQPLDIEALRKPGITLWTATEDGRIIGCVALKRLGPDAAEIKSMRVAREHRGRGVGAALLRYILGEAKAMNLATLYLETGSTDFFVPARKLYERLGFGYCGPFGGYRADEHSVFMKKTL